MRNSNRVRSLIFIAAGILAATITTPVYADSGSTSIPECSAGGRCEVNVGSTHLGTSSFGFECSKCGQIHILPLDVLKTITIGDVEGEK